MAKNYILEPTEMTFNEGLYLDEDAPDIDPGAGLSKNVVHNDHPYNDVEAFLAKQGDPKTGYNTVEKISNATISGGSSGGDGINVLHGEKLYDDDVAFLAINDLPIENIKNLEGKPTFIVWNDDSLGDEEAHQNAFVTTLFEGSAPAICAVYYNFDGSTVKTYTFEPHSFNGERYFAVMLSKK